MVTGDDYNDDKQLLCLEHDKLNINWKVSFKKV
jgi:hypothetical protein